jgi:hypothetical protein
MPEDITTPPHEESTGPQQFGGEEEVEARTSDPFEGNPGHSMTRTEGDGMPGFEATPGDPVVAAQDIGGVATGESSRQIPVIEMDSDTPVDPNTDPDTQAWRAENWEQDPKRAEWMATAVKPSVDQYAKAKNEIKDQAEEIRAQAQQLRDKGVLDEKETSLVERREAAAKLLEQEAANLKFGDGDYLGNLSAKQEKAGELYDAKHHFRTNLIRSAMTMKILQNHWSGQKRISIIPYKSYEKAMIKPAILKRECSP